VLVAISAVVSSIDRAFNPRTALPLVIMHVPDLMKLIN